MHPGCTLWSPKPEAAQVVEMAPALGLDHAREKVLADAVKLARHVGYRNAGVLQLALELPPITPHLLAQTKRNILVQNIFMHICVCWMLQRIL